MIRERIKRWDYWLVGILILAAFLYGWSIWTAGYSNNFYTAAIVSMSESWKNFWYASFDPASFITVDKPPVALWFMVICVKIFGLHGWSIVLSSVLFGIGSVALIYKMIKPYFGRLAANMGAFFMTITPIVVAVSRTNNMDATLVFFLLLAGYLLQVAVSKQRAWLVAVSFALIGVAFNIKMLQAFMVLPAMYFFYWIASTAGWKKKIMHLVAATAALVVFTLLWPLAVDSTSTSKRPYIGSSSTNSVLNLAFGYNGSQRLLGQTSGTGGRFSGMGGSSKKGNHAGKMNGTRPTGSKKMTAPKGMTGNKKAGTAGGQTGKMGQNGGGGGGSNIFNVGSAGPFRLLQKALGQQVSWMFPLALMGLIATFLYEIKKQRRWWQTTKKQQQLFYWAGWLVPVGVFFSIASFFHPYYMVMVAPPLAALAGIGVATFVGALRTSKPQWQLYLLAASFWLTGILQAWYAYSYYPWLSWIIVAGTAAASLLAVFFYRNTLKSMVCAAVATVFLSLAPGFWALTPTLAGASDAIPSAGPDLLSSSGGASGGLGSEQANTKMIKYLEKHNNGAKYLFATMDSNTAAPYIIKTKKAVMTIGGYNGTDNAISLAQFKKLVKEGKVKYFYLSGKTTNSALVRWVKKYGTKVKSSEYSNSSSTQQTTTGKSNTAMKQGTPGKGGKRPSGKAPQGMKGNQMGGRKNMKQGQPGKNGKTSSNSQTSSFGGSMGGQSGTLYKLD
ncbi:glycosyltransferase family 39 protein [Liquorilactobacillus satsumensis]|uniref:glycosyltransferase family 39 protein n=1 Tax=Liquorilactobacillus satsumensis TaxID=259059 RepID=UPI0021C2FC0B|nr:glycosyltransferase family 39 protein [Liquorilactobacillus satsumensis]MCP9312763.1 glycosyltransferase family 39 protein [Liquorilactobacillus satsumensis]MCP9359223.1 glycosyltransferase family 39 protein [Liquorilactobacillus satsumensis]